jgi:hypothetical protein
VVFKSGARFVFVDWLEAFPDVGALVSFEEAVEVETRWLNRLFGLAVGSSSSYSDAVGEEDGRTLRLRLFAGGDAMPAGGGL